MRGIIDKKSGVATAMPIIVRKISVQEIISTYGEPRTIFNSPSGVKTHLYDSFALDVQDGAVIMAVYFAKDFI